LADDTAAFNAAVAYVSSLGGGTILVPAGTYVISSTITVSTSHIVFHGEGFDTYHDVGSSVHPTMLLWSGGAADAIIRFAPVIGASNKALTSCGVVDLAILGDNLVQNCVHASSVRGGVFRFYGGSSVGYVLSIDCVSQLGEPVDSQYNIIELWCRQFSSGGGGLSLSGSTDPTQNGNASFNQVRLLDAQISTGTGIFFGNSDTNFIDQARIIGVTTGMAYIFGGSAVSSARTARGNFIRLISSQGASKAYGTTTYTYPSHDNYVGLDTGNGTPQPTIETGASCWFGSSGGHTRYKPAHARMTLGDSTTNAESERLNVGSESLRVYNASSNHIRLTDGTNEFAICIVGGDIMLNRISGTGVFRLGGWTSNADAAVNGYISIKDNNGVVRKVATIA
jgi:hypothetical protein